MGRSVHMEHGEPASTRPGDLFHVGFVVHDVEAAMSELTAATGVHWRDVGHRRISTRLCDGVRNLDYTAVYTIEGPPHIELVGAMAGTPWWPAGPGQLHHLGYHADDLAAASAAMEKAGLRRAACDTTGANGVPALFAYYQAAGGYFIELLSTKARPRAASAAAAPDGTR
jgi:hypothetical protein